jgi:hypothetical protein
LDDWDKGFSVHKIDADSFDSGSDDDDHQSVVAVAPHLPEPPALRVESPSSHNQVDTGTTFSALGTKIFVFMNRRCGLVYDTDTAMLSVGAHAPAKMVCGFGISVPVDDLLYLLTYRYFNKHGHHSFEAMSWAPTRTALDDDAGTGPGTLCRRRRPRSPPGSAWCPTPCTRTAAPSS